MGPQRDTTEQLSLHLQTSPLPKGYPQPPQLKHAAPFHLFIYIQLPVCYLFAACLLSVILINT